VSACFSAENQASALTRLLVLHTDPEVARDVGRQSQDVSLRFSPSTRSCDYVVTMFGAQVLSTDQLVHRTVRTLNAYRRVPTIDERWHSPATQTRGFDED